MEKEPFSRATQWNAYYTIDHSVIFKIPPIQSNPWKERCLPFIPIFIHAIWILFQNTEAKPVNLWMMVEKNNSTMLYTMYMCSCSHTKRERERFSSDRIHFYSQWFVSMALTITYISGMVDNLSVSLYRETEKNQLKFENMMQVLIRTYLVFSLLLCHTETTSPSSNQVYRRCRCQKGNTKIPKEKSVSFISFMLLRPYLFHIIPLLGREREKKIVSVSCQSQHKIQLNQFVNLLDWACSKQQQHHHHHYRRK